MKKIILSLILLLTLVVVSNQEQKQGGSSRQDTKNQILYKGNFALTWLAGFCKKNDFCDQDLYNLWDRQSFTIHGLWPALTTPGNIKSKYQEFNIKNIDTKLIEEMQNFWPPRAKKGQKNPYWLWEHEYKEHGVYFNQLIKRLNHQKYSTATDKTLQQKYFSSAIGFYIRLNLNKLRRALVGLYLSPSQKVVLRKSDFQKIMDITKTKFYVQCDTKEGLHYLWQIKICFEVYQQQDRLKIRSSMCTSDHRNQDSCKPQFTLIDFDWGNVQQRVTNKVIDAQSKRKSDIFSHENNSKMDL